MTLLRTLHVLLASSVALIEISGALDTIGPHSTSASYEFDGIGDCDSAEECLEESAVSLLQTGVRTSEATRNVVEIESSRRSAELRSRRASGLVMVPDKGLRKTFKALGLQHTGTHLLHEVLSKGFGVAPGIHEPTPVSVKDCGFWKHSSLSHLSQKSPQQLEDCKAGVVGVAMIRNPLAWLKALHEIPYELEMCIRDESNHGVQSWATRPCTLLDTDPVIAATLDDVEFPNLETIWSTWNRDYEALDTFHFPQNVLIRYEDLVNDADGVLRRIAAAANLTLPDEIHIRDQKHLSQKRAQIESHSFRDFFSPSTLRQICERLDVSLMRRHGYNDCDDVVELNGRHEMDRPQTRYEQQDRNGTKLGVENEAVAKVRDDKRIDVKEKEDVFEDAAFRLVSRTKSP